MLDPRFVREHPDLVRAAIRAKQIPEEKADLGRWLERDGRRRDLLADTERLKHERNVVSAEVGRLKKEGRDDPATVARMRGVSDRIQELDRELGTVEAEMEEVARWFPNIPHESVPEGADETANVILRTWGEPVRHPFPARPHWEMAGTRDRLDLARGTKLSGPGFPVLTGALARLQRGLIDWMLELHVKEHGYTEVRIPYLVRRESAFGTGQLPKLEEDMYVTTVDDLFLIPTAEVSITNLLRDETLPEASLPVRLVGYSPCFRREAGAAGRDTRGLLRVHQFDKVEMVRFVAPRTSWDEHEALLANAEEVLRRLSLAYRVVLLATGDLSFAGAKCYDLEVWSPGVGKWLEVSSCSNFTDFQARRIGIKMKPKAGGKPEFLHTLNASGLALPRLVSALLETHQTEDGRVPIPEILWPHLGGLRELA